MAQQLKFILTSHEAESIGIFNILSNEDYPRLTEAAKILARAPISGVQDVVIGVATFTRIFIGVNVEFEGLPLHHSISAEHFLITNLALNDVPFAYACALPAIFDRECFNDVVSDLLVVRRNNHLVLSDPVSAAEICSNPEHCSHLKCRALTAANRSHALYTECPSGVALICEGEVYNGWNIETNLYSFDVGPLQAALVDYVARGEGKGFENIVGAVLVEMNDAVVSQEASVRFLLETIAPGCVFSVFHCYKTQEN